MSILRKLFCSGRPTTPDAPKPTSAFTAVVVSDIGRVRGNNEDNYILDRHMNTSSSDHSEAVVSGVSEPWHMAGVFDGMGGGEAGELASFSSAMRFLSALSGLTRESRKEDADTALRRAFLEANNQIIELQKSYKIYGTTGTVLCSDEREFKLYHLGDSRAYLFRNGSLFQLTKDQTLAQMKLETGFYDRDDPRFEEEKHKLTEYIGRDWTKSHLKPLESLWNPIQSGDKLLLCSDGLYDFCTDSEIGRILQEGGSLEHQASRLVDAANEHGGEDNITCMLISFT